MRLVLDPAQNAAHGHWLRTQPGAYEWWYFDALSDDRRWALTCIWFLGNPFSPYYRLSALGHTADPYAHNALFFALYKDGGLHAYHFTRFPAPQICADEQRPATLRFGPNDLSAHDGAYHLHLADENANRRRLDARLTFTAPPLQARPYEVDTTGAAHFWLPAAPACRVQGRLTLTALHDSDAEAIPFHGRGYHDHNWGVVPFAHDIRDWYWARTTLGDDGALLLYHVRHRQGPPVSHLLQFDAGRLVHHDPQAEVRLARPRLNAFGTPYATRLDVRSGDTHARFHLGQRLDSAPFYLRTLCAADVTVGPRHWSTDGLAEYFRPHALARPLVASATKARIVER